MNDDDPPIKIPEDLRAFADRIYSCWSSVKNSPHFRQVARGNWKLDRVEVRSASDVLSYFKVQVNPRTEVRALAEKLQGVELCCLIGISNDDRTGIEWMPRHVLGRSAVFFLNLDVHDIRHVIIGEYVS